MSRSSPGTENWLSFRPAGRKVAGIHDVLDTTWNFSNNAPKKKLKAYHCNFKNVSKAYAVQVNPFALLIEHVSFEKPIHQRIIGFFVLVFEVGLFFLGVRAHDERYELTQDESIRQIGDGFYLFGKVEAVDLRNQTKVNSLDYLV